MKSTIYVMSLYIHDSIICGEIGAIPYTVFGIVLGFHVLEMSLLGLYHLLN